jgi:hypothetical protein
MVRLNDQLEQLTENVSEPHTWNLYVEGLTGRGVLAGPDEPVPVVASWRFSTAASNEARAAKGWKPIPKGVARGSRWTGLSTSKRYRRNLVEWMEQHLVPRAERWQGQEVRRVYLDDAPPECVQHNHRKPERARGCRGRVVDLEAGDFVAFPTARGTLVVGLLTEGVGQRVADPLTALFDAACEMLIGEGYRVNTRGLDTTRKRRPQYDPNVIDGSYAERNALPPAELVGAVAECGGRSWTTSSGRFGVDVPLERFRQFATRLDLYRLGDPKAFRSDTNERGRGESGVVERYRERGQVHER